MLRIVPHTAPRVGRSYEHFPDGLELHLLHAGGEGVVVRSLEGKDVLQIDAAWKYRSVHSVARITRFSPFTHHKVLQELLSRSVEQKCAAVPRRARIQGS